jgi:GDP-4-dehydro-6-deoxy-D-mannose reductase
VIIPSKESSTTKVMITGAAGFIGGFLKNCCLETGSTVLGIDHTEANEPWTNACFEVCDVRDTANLSRLIASFRPDRIFHLAAQSYPTVSLEKPRETIESNVLGTVNLFESLHALGLKPVVVVACSSAEYGLVASADLPVRETHPLQPLHPYGVSKVAQDLLASQYYVNYSIPVVRIRIFNTTGPGKLGDVCSDLAMRAIRIELGMDRPVLKVGNLTTRRAIADVRDLVRGLWISTAYCEFGDVYNLGGSNIYSIHELVEAVQSQVSVNFSVEQDPPLMRRADEPVIAGDTTKFRNRCPWAPEIPLASTLADMLGWWRNKLTQPVPAVSEGEVR